VAFASFSARARASSGGSLSGTTQALSLRSSVRRHPSNAFDGTCHAPSSYVNCSTALTASGQSTSEDVHTAPLALRQGVAMSLGLILLIVVVLMLVGAVPAWPHSRGWGYGPSGGLGLVLLILLVLVLMGRI